MTGIRTTRDTEHGTGSIQTYRRSEKRTDLVNPSHLYR